MSKGKKSKAAASDTVNYEGLLKEQLKDEKWQPFIILLVPDNLSSLPAHQSIVSAIETKCRRRFVSLDKESVFTTAKEDAKLLSASAAGGGGRKSKQGIAVLSKPLYIEVCQPVTSALASGEVSHDLVARLLKYILLKKRTADLASDQVPQKETEEKPSKGSSAKVKGGPAGDRTSKKGKVTPAVDVDKFPMPQKGSTILKKRGDDLESQYIDDEPQPGPSSYIVLSGFNETELLPQLSQVGIVVDVLIKITNLTETVLSDTCIPPNEENELLQNTLANFWNTIDKVVCSSIAGSTLRDMAILNISCSFDNENESFGLDMFSQLADKVYTILKYQRQYEHYLNYLDMKDIPLTVTCQTQDGEMPATDMRYYHEQLNKLPQEIIGPSLVLKNMLDQVELSLTTNSHPPLDMDTFHPETLSSLNGMFGSFQITTTDEEALNYRPVIHEQDQNQLEFVKTPTSADGYYPEHHPWLLKLFTPPVLPTSLSLSHEEQFHALNQFFASVPQLQVNSLLSSSLAVFSMEHMQPPTVNEEPPADLSIVPCNLIFDHPLNIQLGHNESNSTAVISSLDNDVPTVASENVLLLPERFCDLSQYNILEPLDQNVLLQVIQKYFVTHPYIQLYHQKLTNSLVVAMHSGYCRQSGKYKWQRHVHSRVGFGNFLSYIAERVGSAVDAAAEEGIQSREEIEQKQNQAEASLQEKREANVTPQPDSKSSSAKSSKKSANSSAKKTSKATSFLSEEKAPETSESDELHVPIAVRKLYTGYNVGDKVLLGNGTVATAFTCDGGLITSEHIQFTHEPDTLSVSVIHNNVTLSASFTSEVASDLSATDEPVDVKETSEGKETHNGNETPIGTDTSDTSPVNPLPQLPKSVLFSAFNASLNDNLTLAFSHFGSKGNGQLPVHPKSEAELLKLEQIRPESSQSSRPSSQDKKISKKQQEENQRLVEQQQALDSKNREILLQKVFSEKKAISSGNKHQQLSLTTSNGLYVTCSTIVNNVTSEEPGSTVIIQKFPALPGPLSGEVSRVYLDDGSVLKKMSNGRTFILCHDGKVYESCPASMKKPLAQDASDGGCTNKVSFSNVHETSDDQEVWVVTFPDGKRQAMYTSTEDMNMEETDADSDSRVNREMEDLDPVRTYKIVDPKSQEVLLTREDNVMILKKPDGCMVVDHADGTRITSSSTLCYTFEHPLFIATSFKGLECVLKFPTAEITAFSTGQYAILSNPPGYRLTIGADGEVQYTSDHSVYKIHQCGKSNILSATDSAGVSYNISCSGEIQVDDNITQKIAPIIFHPHFFLIQQDGNGYEIHHSARVKELVTEADQSDEMQVIVEDSIEYSQCRSTVLLSSLSNKKVSSFEVKEIIPKAFMATLEDHNVHAQVGKKRFGANVGRSLNIVDKKVSKYQPRFEEPDVYKYREFIQAKEAVPLETFKACVLKYLEWKQQSESRFQDILPIEVSSTTESSKTSGELRVSSCSAESLRKHYKAAWDARNSLSLSCPVKVKGSCKSIVEDSIDTGEMKYNISKKNFLPYFKSKIGMKFLESILPSAAQVNKMPEHDSSTSHFMPPEEALPAHSTHAYDSSLSPNQVQSTKVTNSVQCTATLVLPPVTGSVQSISGRKDDDKVSTCMNSTTLGSAFEIIPQDLNFGTLREGCTYSAKCSLRNIGIGTSRFTIKPPPTYTGIKVIYSPGEVITGMSSDFVVEIFALANIKSSRNQKNVIYHELEIVTETGILHLPIQAYIYSSGLFDLSYSHAMEGATSLVISNHVCK